MDTKNFCLIINAINCGDFQSSFESNSFKEAEGDRVESDAMMRFFVTAEDASFLVCYREIASFDPLSKKIEIHVPSDCIKVFSPDSEDAYNLRDYQSNVIFALLADHIRIDHFELYAQEQQQYYCNPISGEVASESCWLADYVDDTDESLDEFMSGLVKVYRSDGEWV